jgi:hypothetical protein
MTGKESYLKYKGYISKIDNIEGIVVGYCTTSTLISRVTNGISCSKWDGPDNGRANDMSLNPPVFIDGWSKSDGRIYVTHDVNRIISQPLTTEQIAHNYISNSFKDLTNEKSELYLNIYLSGMNYKHKTNG